MRRGFPFFSFFLLGFSFHFSLPLYFSSFFFFLVFFSFRFLVFLLFFLFSIKNVSFVPLMLDSRIQRQLHPFQHLQFDILLFSFPPFLHFFSSFYPVPFHHHLHPSASVFFSSSFLLSRAIFSFFHTFFPPPLFFSLSIILALSSISPRDATPHFTTSSNSLLPFFFPPGVYFTSYF